MMGFPSRPRPDPQSVPALSPTPAEWRGSQGLEEGQSRRTQKGLG